MPLTVRLNQKITPYLGIDFKVRVYNDLIRIVEKVFSFKPSTIELWVDSSVESLGGYKVETVEWGQLGGTSNMKNLVEDSTDLRGIIVIRGACWDSDEPAKIKISENSMEKKVYSDFFFETSQGLYEDILVMENSNMLMNHLFESLDDLYIDFETRLMGRKIITKRYLVKSAFISDNVPDEIENMKESSFLFMYHHSGNDATFVRHLVKGLGLVLRDKYKKDPLEMLDPNKVAKKISEISRRKGYNPEKYASVKTGSIAYIAKPHENLDRMVEDYSQKIAEPILKNIMEKIELERIMEDSVEDGGPGALEEFDRKEE